MKKRYHSKSFRKWENIDKTRGNIEDVENVSMKRRLKSIKCEYCIILSDVFAGGWMIITSRTNFKWFL